MAGEISNKTVLFVDDDPSTRRSVEETLAHEPYQLVVAESAEVALRLLKTQPIHVIVSDQHMPGLQGSQLIAIVARDHEDITRILLTAKPSVDTTVQAINSGGVYRFLSKPFDGEQLRQVVRGALDEHEQKVLNRELRRLAEAQAKLMQSNHHPPSHGDHDEVENAAGHAANDTGHRGDPLDRLDPATREDLSKRELEILRGLLRGQWVGDLATIHCISPHTVRNHIKSIYRKVGVHSQAELLAKYLGSSAA